MNKKLFVMCVMFLMCGAMSANTCAAQEARQRFVSTTQSAAQNSSNEIAPATQTVAQTDSTDEARYRQLDEAYKLINEQRYAEATPIFEKLAHTEPNNVQIRKQLGYLYIQLKRRQDAINEFAAAHRLKSDDDDVTLQLAYLYDAANEKDAARAIFTEALVSTNPDVQAKARGALKNLTPQDARPYFTEVYSAPFYQTRFSNLISPLDVRVGKVLEPKHNLALYTSLHLTRDSRSSGGTSPQIFADNTAVAGVGARVRPLVNNNLTLYAEAGVSLPFISSNSGVNGRTRGDFRAGAYFFDEWGQKDDHAEKSHTPFTPLGDFYFNTSYYSRFRNNIISYTQFREGVRVLQWNASAIDAYGRAAIVKDTGRDFYNNVGEGGVGVRFTPNRALGFSISTEYVRGFYFGIERSGEPNPYRSQYNDFRIGLTFSRFMAFGQRK